MNGNRRIKLRSLSELHYKEEYAWDFKSKMIEWNEVSNVRQMWERVKQQRFIRVRLCKGGMKEPKELAVKLW